MKSEYLNIRNLLKILVVSILVITSCSDNVLPSFLAGTYTGKERIFIRYDKDGQYIYRDDVVMVSLFIDRSGNVAGMVGDAELDESSVTKNRGWLGKQLGIKTEFLISGVLKGNTFEKDTILNKKISIPFNIENDELRGSLFYISNGHDFPVIKHLNLQKVKD